MSTRKCCASQSSQLSLQGLSSGSHGMHVTLTVKMLNVLALMLVVLPALTSSQEFICCNQPPTPPSPRRKHFHAMAPLMAKRGDRYTLLKRFYEDFARQDLQRDQRGAASSDDNGISPAELSALELAARRAGSGARNQDSLLSRLLEGVRTRSVLENLAQENDADSMLYDSPAKRGTFVRAGGSKSHRKRHRHRHQKHRKH